MTVEAPAAAPSLDFLLTILSGPEKGVSYKLVGQTITLGRAPENDVVLRDFKSSRNHAKVELRAGQYWIVDLGSQNGVKVNGAALRETMLKPGDQITIGTTALKYESSTSASFVNSSPPIPLVQTGHLETQNKNLGAADPAGAGWLPPAKKQKSRRSEPKKRGFQSVIILLMAGALGVIFLQSGPLKRKAFKLKDEESLQTEIETIQDTNQKRVQEITQKGKDTQQYAEAQSFYLRGFREFREGNYPRAIQNFEAALALYPEHPLAKRYLTRSRLKLNEEITAALERGERYFTLEKYMSAFNEYRTVLLLTNDPKSKSAQLAQKRIESINLILMNSR